MLYLGRQKLVQNRHLNMVREWRVYRDRPTRLATEVMLTRRRAYILLTLLGASVCAAQNLNCSTGGYAVPVATTCTSCSPGSFAGAYGLTACPLCSAGSYTTKTGASACTLCTPGMYMERTGESAGCRTCGYGWYAPAQGSTVCIVCQLGTYSDVFTGATCKLCPTGKTTAATGSTSASACTVDAPTTRSDDQNRILASSGPLPNGPLDGGHH